MSISSEGAQCHWASGLRHLLAWFFAIAGSAKPKKLQIVVYCSDES